MICIHIYLYVYYEGESKRKKVYLSTLAKERKGRQTDRRTVPVVLNVGQDGVPGIHHLLLREVVAVPELRDLVVVQPVIVHHHQQLVVARPVNQLF